jgi:hypothetical protein
VPAVPAPIIALQRLRLPYTANIIYTCANNRGSAHAEFACQVEVDEGGSIHCVYPTVVLMYLRFLRSQAPCKQRTGSRRAVSLPSLAEVRGRCRQHGEVWQGSRQDGIQELTLGISKTTVTLIAACVVLTQLGSLPLP